MKIRDGIKLAIGMEIGKFTVYMVSWSFLRFHYINVLEHKNEHKPEECAEAIEFLKNHSACAYSRLVKKGIITEE